MKTTFPNNFYWGSATSGPQTEGSLDRSETIWDYDFKNNPNSFFEKTNVKGDAYKRYPEYVEWASKANFNSLRTSIQWSRLMPNGKNISKKAVDFYRNYFKSLKQRKIKVFVSLFHFDMPMWAMELGGWTSRKVVDAFVDFANKVFENFGDLVDKWFTFNEAIVPIECQYLYKFHHPYEVDMSKALQSLWNIQITHHKIVNNFKNTNLKSEIGIILNITPAIPRSDSKEDLEASEWAAIFQYKALLDSMILGKYPKKLINFAKEKNIMWTIKKGDWELMNKKKMDILGVNYYQPIRVKTLESRKPNPKFIPNEYFYEHYDMPGRIINEHRGWEIYPKGIYDSLMLIKNEYNNLKTYVAENGIGVQGEQKFIDKKTGLINDDYRIDFIKNHLKQVSKAIQDGANCNGYHIWTYIDNWSWLNAYKNRYGIIEFNLETQEFKPKKSFEFLKNLYKNNYFI